MTTKPPLRHMIIFLPGIMGSVLQKDGKDVWALSGQALWQYLRTVGTVGESLQLLKLRDDDWLRDDVGDGVVATSIISDLHSVPGLIQHAGYGPILGRIPQQFDRVTVGSIHQPSEKANFYPFPYDWRRDNRAQARRLQAFIDTWLPRWRQWSGAEDAQVILVAHSMGGLVARYYMEVLGGWRQVRGLITVGTPHRGSPNAIDALSGGIRKPFVDMSAVVRSLTSAYQLLPVYPCVKVDGAFVRLADTDAVPNVEQARAKAARDDFHEAIRQAAIANRRIAGYALRTIPWVGFRQDTLQSAEVADGVLTLSYFAPDGLDPVLAEGDGTVPRISAVPSDWSELEAVQLPRFSAEQHGWLTNNEMTLGPLLETIAQMAAVGGQNLHGRPAGTPAAINLRLDPLVTAGEPVVVQVGVRDTGPGPINLGVRIDPVDKAVRRASQSIQVEPGARASVAFEGLAPGLYRVEVRARGGASTPPPVHAAVEVAGDV